jgi:hypothetical protein
MVASRPSVRRKRKSCRSPPIYHQFLDFSKARFWV